MTAVQAEATPCARHENRSVTAHSGVMCRSEEALDKRYAPIFREMFVDLRPVTSSSAVAELGRITRDMHRDRASRFQGESSFD